MKELEKAREQTLNEYVPHVKSLWQYCDHDSIAKAKYFLTLGGEAVADGYAWMAHNPWFTNLVVAGYVLAARGQLMHVQLLRKLQQELVGKIHGVSPQNSEKPHWDRETGKLIFRGEYVRSVRAIADRLIAILDAFQADCWPARISAPPSIDDDEKLRDAIKVLNRRLKGIKFRADGTGLGIIWEEK
jgi:hypothetical protein